MAENFATARHSMVLSQLRPNNVTSDSVANAMDTVPREEFVPKDLRGVAYMDEDLEVAQDRFLIEPRVFGLLVQAAEVTDTDVVLDIACGTGYSSAVLGNLAQAVVSIEDNAALVEKASNILMGLEADNVAVIEAELDAGNAKQGPYNVIHINGAVDAAPQTLLDQLADEGRLICVLGTNPGVATLYRRQGDNFYATSLFNAAVPAIGSMKAKAGFSF
ncbi:MAG: protein-L-isoaspartate O-methyltransferase [Sneathiella sp.]|nr:protein-L-isoaspartate O-methyltransferase [Sneathiella sp.]